MREELFSVVIWWMPSSCSLADVGLVGLRGGRVVYVQSVGRASNSEIQVAGLAKYILIYD